jgi:hypothetical protein
LVNISPPQDGLTPFQRRLRGVPDQGATSPQPQRALASTEDLLNLTVPQVPKEDVSARVLKTSMRLGLDRDLVGANLEEAEKLAAEKEIDPQKLTPVLKRWYSESPHHIAVTKADVKSLQDLERTYYRRDDPLRPMDDDHKQELIKRMGERAGRESFQAAQMQGLRMYKDEAAAIKFATEMAKQQVEEVESYVTDKGPGGAFSAPNSVLRKIPVIGLGVDVSEAAMLGAMKRIQAGNGTEDDEDAVFLFGRLHAAAASRGQTFGGKVLEGIASLPAFAAEFALTDGAFRVGKVGAEIALRKSLQKIMTGRARGMVRSAVGGLAGGATQTAAQASLSLPADAIKRMMPEVTVTSDEEGRLRAVLEEPGDDVLPAITKAFGARFVENLSERSGLAVSKLLAPVKAKVASRWLKLNPGKNVNDFLGKVAEKTGWNGVIEEVFEERVGEAGRAVLGLEEYKLPSAEDFAAEVLTLAAPAGGSALVRGGASLIRARANQNFLKSAQKIVREAKVSTLAPEALEDMNFAYVPSTAWVEQMGKVGKDAKQEALSLGASEASYDRAVQLGGNLQLPMAQFVVRVLKEPHGDAFLPLARTEVEEDTLEEAEEESKKDRSSTQDSTTETVLDQSPEGLEGEAYTALVDKQVKAGLLHRWRTRGRGSSWWEGYRPKDGGRS